MSKSIIQMEAEMVQYMRSIHQDVMLYEPKTTTEYCILNNVKERIEFAITGQHEIVDTRLVKEVGGE